MSKVGLSKDGLSKDGMSKDGLSKDGLSKDGLSKDGMSKAGSNKIGLYFPLFRGAGLSWINVIKKDGEEREDQQNRGREYQESETYLEQGGEERDKSIGKKDRIDR